MAAALLVRWLGRIGYAEALALQESLVEARRAGRAPDSLLLLEHPPVITLGRTAQAAHVLATPEDLARRGVGLFESGRGGDVTYHGPGQLVGYPILALGEGRRDAHRYLRDLEQALILVCSDFGVAAERVAGLTGVWTAGAKIAAIGVRLASGWITSHGFALNVTTDLAEFEAIVPCGLAGRAVTSLAAQTGREIDLREVAERAAVRLAGVFGLEPSWDSEGMSSPRPESD